ncbi:MAG TPA: low molecular weight protein-tyrosine-phosphatase [Solirubrobacteraceae bacterium]|nr:low molecular weight protein-tyrosine-phosphatase [Solirubrobacteraceae bacterium]
MATAAGQAQARRARPVRLLFVCLGNICRSPTAEGTMATLVREAGLEGEIELDSAGTGSWHVGSAPDERATAAAARRGIALEGAARRVRDEDFDEFDLILAMDSSNFGDLLALAGGERSRREKVRLLREFDPASAAHGPEGRGAGELDVPDPYYGAGDGFERVLDHVQAACAGLLAQIRAGTLP